MKLSLFLLALLISLNSGGCEDLFGTDEDEYEDVYSKKNASYTYTYTCAATGSTNEIEIPEGTAACQKAHEYFARMYGCNEADYFNEANCRLCKDCGYQNYCSVCN